MRSDGLGCLPTGRVDADPDGRERPARSDTAAFSFAQAPLLLMDALPPELQERIVARCTARAALRLQRCSTSFRAVVQGCLLNSPEVLSELLGMAHVSLSRVAECLGSEQARGAFEAFGLPVDGFTLREVHLRAAAGAELQRRLDVQLHLDALSLNGPGRVLYQAEGNDGYDPEENGYAFGGTAEICFGIVLGYQELRKLLYVGRRWYGSAGSSESVTVDADPARGAYYDFTDVAALTNAVESHDYDGPWLQYHLPHAFNDLLDRVGMPNVRPEPDSSYSDWARKQNQNLHSSIDIHFTGFQDGAGDDVVVGIRLGPHLPASGFDLRSQLDASFLQGNDFEDSPGHAIQDVSTHFPAQILGWPADSLQHRALEAELHSRMEKVLRALNIADRRSELGFSVVFDEGC